MKHLIIYCGLFFAAISAAAQAQDVTVDNYEGYADSAAAKAKYVSVAGNGAETVELGVGGGANSTANWLKLVDNGYTCGIGATGIITPPAGTYKLSFYWKNGLDSTKRWRGIKASIIQGTTLKTAVLVDPGTNAPDTLTWTYAESTVFTLTNDPINIRFDSGASNGADPVWTAAVDEVILTPITGPAISVFPDNRVYLSRTKTIVPTLEGGSGTYSKVEYDVNNDGSVERTATVAPFEFTWNTLTDVPQDTSRTLSTTPPNTTIPVKITVTDSTNATKSVVENYTVDNEYNGRTSMISNGNFDAFADGASFGTNLPAGWVTQVVAPGATYGPGDSYSPSAGQALHINFVGANNADSSDRYTLRTVGKTGRYRDMQATWWGEGSFCRLYYFTSTDDGATFANTFQTAGEANNTIWTFVVESPVQNDIGLTDTSQVALATHTLGSSLTPQDYYWDDITWEGNLLPPSTSSVPAWNLY